MGHSPVYEQAAQIKQAVSSGAVSWWSLAGTRDSSQADQVTALSLRAAGLHDSKSLLNDLLEKAWLPQVQPLHAARRLFLNDPTRPVLLTNHLKLLIEYRTKPNHLHEEHRTRHALIPTGLSSLIAGLSTPGTLSSGSPSPAVPQTRS